MNHAPGKTAKGYVANAWCSTECSWQVEATGYGCGSKISRLAREHTRKTGHITEVDSQQLWSWLP